MCHVLQNVFDPVHAAWEGDKRSRGSSSRKKKDFPLEIRRAVVSLTQTPHVLWFPPWQPSMEETLRPLLWEDASSVCGSNLHFCTQNKLNIKIKSGNAKKWICSVEIFFFFNRIKYRPSFYNFQELQTRNSPVLFSICTQHERAGSPVTKVNSWPQQKTVFSDIMSVWNKPIMQTRSRVVIMEPCDGDLKLWKFPRTFQTGLCPRGKSNRPVFLNPSWWQTCDTPLNVRSLNTGLFL